MKDKNQFEDILGKTFEELEEKEMYKVVENSKKGYIFECAKWFLISGTISGVASVVIGLLAKK
ncbi:MULTISPECIES: hypothetical protein [Caldicellulosiruptor]|uniref:Uncharacterized protein n=1 Tax=Caldicellulosiruptor morganii TaxID=1387555 RepID=A0ABY7BIY2_9FIRM|nr:MULTISPECIES: hypothetical protein [Caldicellulosiruptor]WAM32779.1 hypothetical protein OTK00_001224 [Caldicellulosiruptor morganii]